MAHRATVKHEGANPNWALRKWLAAVAVTFCFGALVIDGNIKTQTAKTEAAVAVQEAELDRLVLNYQKQQTEAVGEAPQNNLLPVSAEKPVEDLLDFDFSALKAAEIKADERRCLTEALYYESRAEPVIGQMAVADVILNRVASPLYPDSICGVVYQGSTRKTGCQFSFTCDGSLNRKINKQAWVKSENLAGAVIAGVHIPVSRNATHYHASYVKPYWAPNLTPTAEIGEHLFYRFPARKVTSAAQ